MFSTKKLTQKNFANEILGEAFRFWFRPFSLQNGPSVINASLLGTLKEGMLWFFWEHGDTLSVIPLMMKKPKKKEMASPPENQEDDKEKTTNAIAAATLSILGGMGHVYLGVERRGYFLLMISLGLILVSKFFWPTGWLIYGQWVILTGFDAFAFGKRGRGFF